MFGTILIAKTMGTGSPLGAGRPPDKFGARHPAVEERRPWWRAGGMHVTTFGQIFTTIVPIIMFVGQGCTSAWVYFLCALATALIATSAPGSGGDFYVMAILPSYVVSLVAGFALLDNVAVRAHNLGPRVCRSLRRLQPTVPTTTAVSSFLHTPRPRHL